MSTVSEQVEAYIAYKQGLGIAMRSEVCTMRQLARYAAEVGHDGPVDVGLAVAWARSGGRHAVFDRVKVDSTQNGTFIPGMNVPLRTYNTPMRS